MNKFKFNPHYELKDRHAFLSASKYSWLRYDDVKLIETFDKAMNAALGSRLHDLAKELIQLGIKLQRSDKTLNAYVNDAIGYKMEPEVPLYYSENVFGTADAIGYTKAPRNFEYEGKSYSHILRIHDLKNGTTIAKMDQLLIYAGLFFLEYRIRPEDVYVELRIYQGDEMEVLVPELRDISFVMNHIVHCDQVLEDRREEAF